MTLLSILACDGIALPLSPSFPTGELRYILDNSQTGLLLATEKYSNKAQELVQVDLENIPVLRILDKIETGADPAAQLHFQDAADLRGGMMLYTSGTTNRPVSSFGRDTYKNHGKFYLRTFIERSPPPAICSISANPVLGGGMVILPRRPTAPCPPPPPHPRHGQCHSRPVASGLLYRVHVSLQPNRSLESASSAIPATQQSQQCFY